MFEDIEAGEYGYIIVGRTLNPGGTVQQITKLRSDGTVHWARKMTHHTWQGEVHDPYLNSMTVINKVNEESLVMAGQVTFKKQSQRKYYTHFAMMDIGGQWLHSNLLDLTSYTDDVPTINNIAKIGDGFIATGFVQSQQELVMIIVRLDLNLKVKWLNMVSNTGATTFPTGLTAAGTNEFLITGQSTDLFVLRMDIYGQLISLYDYIWPDVKPRSGDIFVDVSGNVYVTGSAFIDKPFGGNDSDVFVMKTDALGSVNSVRHFGSSSDNEYLESSVRMSNGLYVLSAETGKVDQRHLFSVSPSVPFPCDEEIIGIEKNSGEYIVFDLGVVQRTAECDLHEMELVVEEVPVEHETCGHTNPEEIKLPNSPNTPSQDQNAEFAIYPNPTPGVIDVSWKSTKTSQIEKIEIYEITGKNIFSNEVKHLNQFRTVLPNSGMYILP